jgi:hypothetical protein
MSNQWSLSVTVLLKKLNKKILNENTKFDKLFKKLLIPIKLSEIKISLKAFQVKGATPAAQHKK